MAGELWGGGTCGSPEKGGEAHPSGAGRLGLRGGRDWRRDSRKPKCKKHIGFRGEENDMI